VRLGKAAAVWAATITLSLALPGAAFATVSGPASGPATGAPGLVRTVRYLGYQVRAGERGECSGSGSGELTG
jgi:hypothetical protein